MNAKNNLMMSPLGRHLITFTKPTPANDNSYLQLVVNNTAGNVATVSNTPSGGSATTVANYSAGYLPFGPPKGVTLGNGIATSYTYDKDLNLLTILSDNSTQNLTYTYDNAGNLTNIADSLNSANNQTLCVCQDNDMDLYKKIYDARVRRLQGQINNFNDQYIQCLVEHGILF